MCELRIVRRAETFGKKVHERCLTGNVMLSTEACVNLRLTMDRPLASSCRSTPKLFSFEMGYDLSGFAIAHLTCSLQTEPPP